MTPSPTNPWAPGYSCPFSLLGLEIGMTVHVNLVGGPVKTGTLVAVSMQAISLDDLTDRNYIPFARIQGLTWTRS